MHLLPTSEVRLDDGEDAVDLALPPGDLVVLSFSDSDLSALAAAAPDSGLALRLVPLRRFDVIFDFQNPGDRKDHPGQIREHRNQSRNTTE